MTAFRTLSAVFACAALCTLSGCASDVKESGYTFLQRSIENTEITGKTRREIQETLGTPSAVSSIDTEKWYYISTAVEDRSIFKRDIKERRVLEIVFDDSGKAVSYKEYDKSASRNIAFDGDTTFTAGNKVGILEQLLGNIGRFPAGNVPVNP